MSNQEWILREGAVNEIGCVHTTQGYDLNYVAVIFGHEIDYDDEQLIEHYLSRSEADAKNVFDLIDVFLKKGLSVSLTRFRTQGKRAPQPS